MYLGLSLISYDKELRISFDANSSNKEVLASLSACLLGLLNEAAIP